ncbi:hypothetical protein D3C80_1855360 [compost metagenome]
MAIPAREAVAPAPKKLPWVVPADSVALVDGLIAVAIPVNAAVVLLMPAFSETFKAPLARLPDKVGVAAPKVAVRLPDSRLAPE